MEHDLGILFVHGIGQQKRGDTLVQFGEPLHDWIRRWVTEDGHKSTDGAVFSLQDARLRPVEEMPGALAHAFGRLRVDGVEKKVLLAECCWGESFTSPTFGELARWLRNAALVTPSLHFGTRFRRSRQALKNSTGWRRAAVALFLLRDLLYFLLLSPLLTIAAVYATIILGIANLVPGLGGVVRRVQLTLAAYLGDSYVLLARPIQEAAIVGQVTRDLEWLVGQHCKCIAIMAHSQGAAVTHRALRRSIPEKMTPENSLLITFGSGIRKLEELRWSRDSEQGRSVGRATLVGIGLMIVGAFILGLLPIHVHWLTDSKYWGYVSMIVGGGFWVSDLMLSEAGVSLSATSFVPAPVPDRAPPWRDFYASADPVSNGPLLNPDAAPSYLNLTSNEVHNRASNLSDHSTYFFNQEQFVTEAVCLITKLTGIDLRRRKGSPSGKTDESLIRQAALWRKIRVKLLGYSRAVILIAGVVATAILGANGRLYDLGARTQAGALRLMKMEPVGLEHPILRRILNRGFEWLGTQIEKAQEWVDPAWLGGLLLLIGLWILYRIFVEFVWSIWDAGEVTSFFRRLPFSGFGWAAVLFVASTIVLFDALLAVALKVAPLPGEGSAADWIRLAVYASLPGAVSSVFQLEWRALGGDSDGALGRWIPIAMLNWVLGTPLMIAILATPLGGDRIQFRSNYWAWLAVIVLCAVLIESMRRIRIGLTKLAQICAAG